METGQEPQKFDCRREEGKGIRDRLNDHVHKGFVFDKVWNPDSKKKKKNIIDLDPYLLQSPKAITTQHKGCNTL